MYFCLHLHLLAEGLTPTADGHADGSSLERQLKFERSVEALLQRFVVRARTTDCMPVPFFCSVGFAVSD